MGIKPYKRRFVEDNIPKKSRLEELESFAKELKQIVRNSGRTNVIPIRILEELFVKYNIRLKK